MATSCVRISPTLFGLQLKFDENYYLSHLDFKNVVASVIVLSCINAIGWAVTELQPDEISVKFKSSAKIVSEIGIYLLLMVYNNDAICLI